MQSSSRAPVLSATRRRDSCWITGHSPCRSRSMPAKSKQRKNAGSARSRRLRARLRTRRCAALQPRSECEMGKRGPPLDLRPLEDLDAVALAELHDRLLPARLLAAVCAAPLRLRLHHRDVDALHLDVEQLLDGLADLRLVRVRMDVEAVLPLVDGAVGFLGHDRREEYLIRMETHERSPRVPIVLAS